jgi:hypothetical protein
MNKYKVIIKSQVIVDAEDEEEARERAYDYFMDEEVSELTYNVRLIQRGYDKEISE